MKIDLKDITFTIPFKKDTDQRLENLLTIINYLKKYFITNIMVWEQDSERKFPEIEDVKYNFIKTSDYILLRTKMLNDMCKKSSTPFIANYDTDVILPIQQYVNAISLLRKKQADAVFPYGGGFYNFIGENRKFIIDNVSIGSLTEHNGHLNHPQSVGGVLLWNKQKYIEGGMENENFKSWGYEDNERVIRFTKLGYNIVRIPGILYHLDHPTSVNSSNTHHQAYYENQQEFMKINNMHPSLLRSYVNSWPWTKY